MPADDGHTGPISRGPAAGRGIKVEGVLHFLHHAAVQHQLGGDHALGVGAAAANVAAPVGGELVLLSQHALNGAGRGWFPLSV